MGEQTPLPWICFRSYGTRSYTHDTCMRPSFSLPCTSDGFVRSVYRHRRVCQGRLYVSPWLNFGIQFKRDGGWTWEARVSPPPKLSTFNLSFIWSSFAAAIHLLYHTCITRWAPTRREDARRCSAYARKRSKYIKRSYCNAVHSSIGQRSTHKRYNYSPAKGCARGNCWHITALLSF